MRRSPQGLPWRPSGYDSQYRRHGFNPWLGKSAPACCRAQSKRERERRSPILPSNHPPLTPQALASNPSPAFPPYSSDQALPPSWATSSTSRSISDLSLGVCVSIWNLQSNFSGRGVYLKGERGGYLHKAKHCGGLSPF